jgi:glutamate dehydrogenase
MKELLSLERIYELVSRNLELSIKLFEDFRNNALGHQSPSFSKELEEAIDKSCTDLQDRQILRMLLTFNQSILLTNFFKAQTPSAFAFCLDPVVVLKDRPTSLYPEKPFCIYLISGKDFSGFHVRFRDVARGGLRLIPSRDRSAYERNFATLFDECYNLAYTQQNKNKDIPEGGAKGVLLPEISSVGSLTPSFMKSCFTQYVHALLDCMMPQQSKVYDGHMKGRQELLYFGPDENTAGFMDHGAELAKSRSYPHWKAITTGKSVKLGGIPHDTYGMTTCSVHTYVVGLLDMLGEREEAITKFQTGGPDGDLGSNQILVSKDMTIGIVDGSGVLYDPVGLNRAELTRLAKRRLPVKHFSRAFLGTSAFLVTIDDTDVVLPDGSKWHTGAELRDNFIFTEYATADLFVPCGGRPNTVTRDNVKKIFHPDGRPKFRMIVEGANLFFSDGSRGVLEKAGVHVFKDASTNKGGVTSSSLEVFAALALPPQDHTSLLTYDPEGEGEPPEFYQKYVQEILEIISENAKQEFSAIWNANQRDGLLKIDATSRLSCQINVMTDSIHKQFSQMSEEDRDQLIRSVLVKAVPPLMIQRLGVSGIVDRVPQNYVRSIVAAWIASRYVYQHGINASEVSFFFFMNSLLGRGSQNLADASHHTENGFDTAKRPRLH